MIAKRMLQTPFLYARLSRRKLRSYLNGLTQRQRLWILLGMFLFIAALETWQIYRGCSAEVKIEHIEPIKK